MGVFNLTGGGGFISKLDASGNFIWAKAIGGNSNSIAIDPSGSGAVYTIGNFVGTVDFDPDSLGSFNLTSAGGDDIFISKLDSSGNFVWAKALGGTDFDHGHSIAIDTAGSGDVYTTGSFAGTSDFDPGAGIFNLTSSSLIVDIFISKLDSSGNFVWAKAMGEPGYAEGLSIAIDPAGTGEVYTTGDFEGTVDFDPGAGVLNLTSAGNEDIFISKLDLSGNFVWAKAMSGTGNDNGNSIAIDPAGSGDVYTTGFFSGTADFDPDSSGSFNLTSAGGSYDIFISKLDSSGNFVWAKAMGGTSYDYGRFITIDPAGSGDVYTTGWFNGTADFNPGAGTFYLTAAGNQAIFISKLDGLGNFVWAKAAGGLSNGAYGQSIALDASGNVYVTGGFLFPITFGSTTLTNVGGIYADIFIAKIDTVVVTGINALENFNSEVSIFPNPFSNSTTISFSLSKPQKVSIKIFDLNGRLVAIPTDVGTDKIFEAGENEIIWNVAEINAGIYFLRMETVNYSENRKLIVTK